ncbi:MAG: hypothetical protein H6729_16265 [Deltaproteobacteria bacterium]|nr:hypothetical protein [Deltaproteobacteria bacterium]
MKRVQFQRAGVIVLGLTFSVVLSTTTVTMPREARAQDIDLHFTQVGGQLERADGDLRVLNAGVTAKVFDPALAQAVIKELEAAFGAAKKSTDRSTALLSDAQRKFEPEMLKLREAIKACEDQLRLLATDIDEQTGGAAEDDGDDDADTPSTALSGTDDLERAANAPDKVKADWELLRASTGWLGVDLAAARDKYKRLARRLKLKPYPYPKKPKGKRPS